MRSRVVASLLLASIVCTLGCAARPIRRDVFKQEGIDVFLRSEKRFTSTVEKQYEHPVTIAPVRLAHILSRIDVRVEAGKKKQRIAAIPTDMLFAIAEGVSQALAEATPDEEVVAMAIARSKRFYLFDRKHLTSFVAYQRGAHLYVHLSRTQWEIPPRKKDDIPEPRIGAHPMSFKVFPGEAMAMVDTQSLAVDWRHAVFRTPTRTRVLPSGEVVRKTILLESPVGDWEDDSPPTGERLEDLGPDQLRDLADLEERRRSGLVTEAEYSVQRKAILAR